MANRSPLVEGLGLVRGYATQQRRPFLIAVAGSVVYAAGSVGAAWGLGYATDEALVPLYAGADPAHWAAVALIIGIMVLRSAGVIVRRYFAGMTAAQARRRLQRELGDRYVSMPVDHLRARPAGELLAGIDADTDAAVDVIHPLPFTIGVLSMLVFAVAQLGAIDGPLLIATVGLLPLVLVFSIATTLYLEKPTARERSANAAVTAATTEIIAGTQVIKTLGVEESELERFAELTDELRARRVHLSVVKTAVDSLLQLIPQLAMIVIIVVGARRVEAGALDAGGLVQAVALFGILAFPLQVIGFFLTDLPISVVGRRRVDALLAEPDDPLATAGTGAPLPAGPLSVSLVDVGVGDPERGAARLNGINLTVEPGETLAVVGPTAGGKSSLLEALARLRTIDRGELRFADTPAEEIANQVLRSRVGVAAQTAVLFSGTIRENVSFGRDISDDAVEAALTAAGAASLADTLPDGFDTVVGERGVALSGGQRQRVALARALAGQPGLVLLDDATSAIDPATEESILATLAELPTSVVLVTHRVAAMATADRVAFVADGQIIDVGPHASLLARDHYRELVEAYRADEGLR